MPKATGSTLAWAALSIAAFPAALLATVPLVTIPFRVGLGSLVSEAGWDVHLVQMALWPMVWGTLSCAAIWLAGRVTLAAPAPTAVGIAIAAVGFVVAAWHHVVLQQWQLERLGIIDPDQVGWTAGLFALLVGIGVAAFGASLAPRAIAWLPAALLVLGSIGVLLVALSNLGGVTDGVDPASIPLGLTIATAAGYALLAAAITIRGSLGSPQPE